MHLFERLLLGPQGKYEAALREDAGVDTKVFPHTYHFRDVVEVIVGHEPEYKDLRLLIKKDAAAIDALQKKMAVDAYGKNEIIREKIESLLTVNLVGKFITEHRYVRSRVLKTGAPNAAVIERLFTVSMLISLGQSIVEQLKMLLPLRGIIEQSILTKLADISTGLDNSDPGTVDILRVMVEKHRQRVQAMQMPTRDVDATLAFLESAHGLCVQEHTHKPGEP